MSGRGIALSGTMLSDVVPSLRGSVASPPVDGRIQNAMTIDVEDYFHVSAFERHIDRRRWDSFESRVVANTDRLLRLVAAADVRATFFVLGWVAERFPDLVARIARDGHEIASHGYSHRLVYDMTPREFAEDIRRAKALLERISGQPVLGYRAPSYSITRQSLWAFDVLLDEGYVYDASVFPIHHDRYGIPDAPRFPYRVTRAAGSLWELPGSTVRWAGQNLPIGGGGYFRLLPYGWTRRGIAYVNSIERRPVMFYLHPWEIDPGQPRIEAPLVSRFRHYRNLGKTEPRLSRLLAEFRFDTALNMLTTASTEPAGALAVPSFAIQ
jgi:polysaccharide deacetylase family protein (PEP-CTERM system associated)